MVCTERLTYQLFSLIFNVKSVCVEGDYANFTFCARDA